MRYMATVLFHVRPGKEKQWAEADEYVEGARAHAFGERLKRERSFRFDR